MSDRYESVFPAKHKETNIVQSNHSLRGLREPSVSRTAIHGKECVDIANRAFGYREVLRRVLECNGLTPDAVDKILALARDRNIDAAILAASQPAQQEQPR